MKWLGFAWSSMALALGLLVATPDDLLAQGRGRPGGGGGGARPSMGRVGGAGAAPMGGGMARPALRLATRRVLRCRVVAWALPWPDRLLEPRQDGQTRYRATSVVAIACLVAQALVLLRVERKGWAVTRWRDQRLGESLALVVVHRIGRLLVGSPTWEATH
jgi:hypothetical protein